MKYIVAIVLLLAVVGGGAVLWRMQMLAAAASANAVPDTKAVARRTIHRGITATGTVASNLDVDIKCQASGKVIKLPVDISRPVKAGELLPDGTEKPGELLMELDPVDQQRTLDQAKAQVKASKARQEQAKMNFDIAVKNLETTRKRTAADLESATAKANDAHAKAERTEKLFNATPVSLASKEEVETAKTAVALADASLVNANAAVTELEQQEISVLSKKQDILSADAQYDQDVIRQKLAEQQLDYTKVFVPVAPPGTDYRVASLGTGVQIGAIVQSGSSGFSGGTTVMTLSDLSHIFILATVDESDIGMVRLGQTVRITADAYQGVRFDGKVVRIATKGVSTNNVVTFEVKIEVTDVNRLLLKPMMTANVELILEESEDALVVPLAAITKTKPDAAAEASTRSASMSSGPSSRPSGGEPGRRGGRGGRGGRGPGGGGGGAVQPDALITSTPAAAWVRVYKSENSIESREVMTGISDGNDCEILSGLEEGDLVIINKASTDSRSRGTNPLQQFRGLTGGGGGGGGGGGRGGR